MSHIDFDARSSEAVKELVRLEAFPLDTILERANKAVLDQQWPTASLLFQALSSKAIRMGLHCMEQEVKLLKDANGKEQED